jgi:hypothetical protein
MSVLKTKHVESRFFNFKLFRKDATDDANTLRTYFLGFFVVFLLFFGFFNFFEKWGMKLGKTTWSNTTH